MNGLDFALEVMVIGFLVVIVTLVGLYGILLLFNRFFYKSAETDLSAGTSGLVSTKDNSVTDSDQRKAAAIIGAVYQYLSEKEDNSKLGRVSITVQPEGVASAESWKMIGRKELHSSRAILDKMRRKNQGEKI